MEGRTLAVQDCAAKARSKKEIYKFLTIQGNVYFKKLILNKFKYENWLKINQLMHRKIALIKLKIKYNLSIYSKLIAPTSDLGVQSHEWIHEIAQGTKKVKLNIRYLLL